LVVHVLGLYKVKLYQCPRYKDERLFPNRAVVLTVALLIPCTRYP